MNASQQACCVPRRADGPAIIRSVIASLSSQQQCVRWNKAAMSSGHRDMIKHMPPRWAAHIGWNCLLPRHWYLLLHCSGVNAYAIWQIAGECETEEHICVCMSRISARQYLHLHQMHRSAHIIAWTIGACCACLLGGSEVCSQNRKSGSHECRILLWQTLCCMFACHDQGYAY